MSGKGPMWYMLTIHKASPALLILRHFSTQEQNDKRPICTRGRGVVCHAPHFGFVGRVRVQERGGLAGFYVLLFMLPVSPSLTLGEARFTISPPLTLVEARFTKGQNPEGRRCKTDDAPRCAFPTAPV